MDMVITNEEWITTIFHRIPSEWSTIRSAFFHHIILNYTWEMCTFYHIRITSFYSTWKTCWRLWIFKKIWSGRKREFGRLRERTVTIFQSRKKVMCNLIASLRFQVFPVFSFVCSLALVLASNPFDWMAWMRCMNSKVKFDFLRSCNGSKFWMAFYHEMSFDKIILYIVFLWKVFFGWLFTFNKQMVFPYTTIKYWHFVCRNVNGCGI